MAKLICQGTAKIPYGNHSSRTVILASDHKGYSMKKDILDYLRMQGMRVSDIGTHNTTRCDYPQISSDLGLLISNDLLCDTVGIGICGSGIGIGIPASKWSGVYAARCLTPEDAKMSRKHNNSNLLTLAADILSFDDAMEIVDAWLWEPFDLKEPYLSRFVQTVELEKKVY